MNTSTTNKPRQESDRQGEKKWYSALMARPEVGPLGVMILLFFMLGYFSIPEGEFSLNPFSGEGFNALGIRNNFRVIAQLGIVALAAGMLIIAGEFEGVLTFSDKKNNKPFVRVDFEYVRLVALNMGLISSVSRLTQINRDLESMEEAS